MMAYMAGYKERIRNVVRRVLAPMEKSMLNKHRDLKYRPVFMIGPPRSGSTLLYQLLARRYRCCYFSNLMMNFPLTPISIARMAKPFNGCDPPDQFENWYGETTEWRAPSQGLPFWFQCLPPVTHELEVDVLTPEISHRIHSTMAALQDIYGAPFINKWQPNSMRLALLAGIFPEALFIRMTRQKRSIIRSILRARAEICGSGSGWFSIKPRGYKNMLSRPEVEQVEWQIDRIEETIETHMKRIGLDRFYTVSFEELREHPLVMMDRVNDFYAKNGNSKKLEIRHSIPKVFTARNVEPMGS